MCAHHGVIECFTKEPFCWFCFGFLWFGLVVVCFFVLFSFGGDFLCFVVVGFGCLGVLLLFSCRPVRSSDSIKEIVANLAGPYTSTRTESDSRALKKIGGDRDTTLGF